MNTIDSPLFGLSQTASAVERAGRAGAARRAAGQQQGVRAGLGVPGPGAFRRPDPRPHLPGDLAPDRGRPARRRGDAEGRIRAFRRAGGGRRHRLSGAASHRDGRHHQRRRIRPRDPRRLAAAPVDRYRRDGGQQRLRRRPRTGRRRADRGRRAVAVRACDATAAPAAGSSPSSAR